MSAVLAGFDAARPLRYNINCNRKESGINMTAEFTIAVHALVYLDERNCPLKSEEIAGNVCTNPARIRKVMAKLKKAGLVAAKEGADGGYRFELEPQQVTLLSVCEAVGGCDVASSWRSGRPDVPCMVASGMAAVMDGLYQDLNGACRGRLGEWTLADIEKRLSARAGE